jgi:hypothetical protein
MSDQLDTPINYSFVYFYVGRLCIMPSDRHLGN